MPEGPEQDSSLTDLFSIIDGPARFFREKIANPLQQKERPKYYHQRFRRIPSIDECEVDDNVCYYEVNEQFKRDRSVDSQILNIVRQRRLECETYYGHDKAKRCEKLKQDYETAETNWFIKYGDLGAKQCVIGAYMKQKHRLLWERRHGEVGTGMSAPAVE